MVVQKILMTLNSFNNLGASGGVASSLFSFKNNNESVLVNYLTKFEIDEINKS